MNGGTLTLTTDTNPIQEPAGEAGTAWRFNFGGGDVYLGGNQRAIADTFWFNVTGPIAQYRAIYDSGTDVTHLYYASASTPGTLIYGK